MKQSNNKTTGVYLRSASPCNLGIWKQECSVNKYLQEAGDSCNIFYYRDNGFSGCTAERPALQEMLGQIAEGTINRVIVPTIDRLARGFLLMGELTDFLDAHHVQLISLDGATDDGLHQKLVGVLS